MGPGPPKTSLALPSPTAKATVPVQRLSPTQMKERRDKRLCYNCDDKWAPGHKCRVAKLFIMKCEDSGDEEDTKSMPPLIEEGGSSSKHYGEVDKVHAKISPINFNPCDLRITKPKHYENYRTNQWSKDCYFN